MDFVTRNVHRSTGTYVHRKRRHGLQAAAGGRQGHQRRRRTNSSTNRRTCCYSYGQWTDELGGTSQQSNFRHAVMGCKSSVSEVSEQHVHTVPRRRGSTIIWLLSPLHMGLMYSYRKPLSAYWPGNMLQKMVKKKKKHSPGRVVMGFLFQWPESELNV